MRLTSQCLFMQTMGSDEIDILGESARRLAIGNEL